MDYRNLGQSGLKVSTLCLGTMTFGDSAGSMMQGIGSDEATAHAIMDRALDAGVSFFDTADVYGIDGHSEKVIGNWFASTKKRDRVVLATKFRFRMGQGPNDTGASRLRVMRAVDESLQRLKTDRIDLYQVHCQDIDTPEEETLRALDDCVRAGKVLYLGCSNYAAYRLVDSLWTAKKQKLHRYVALQAQYSLVTRELEREHVPLCQRFGLGILPWSPLAGGFLSGKYRRDQSPPAGTRMDKYKERLASYDNPRNWAILDAVEAIAKARDTSLTAVALAWLVQKPAVTSVIFGARSLEQLQDNLRAATLKLTAEEMKRLDDASRFELGYPYDFIRNIQGRW